MSEEVDDFLEHFGVKGMKWGKRKAEGGTSSESNSASTKRLSRKEVRKINREGQRAHDTKRVNDVLAESLKKGDDILVSTMFAGETYKTILTGKEFAERAAAGSHINARMTDVFASKKSGDNPYELRDNSQANYQKVKR